MQNSVQSNITRICTCWLAFLRPFEAIRANSEKRLQKNNLREENLVRELGQRGPFFPRTSVLMVQLLAALRQNEQMPVHLVTSTQHIDGNLFHPDNTTFVRYCVEPERFLSPHVAVY